MRKKHNLRELYQIKTAVEKRLKLKITRKSRKAEYVRARLIFYRLCVDFTIHSLGRIGYTVGTDHASVLHNLQNFEKDILGCSGYSKEYKAIYDYLFPFFDETEYNCVAGDVDARFDLEEEKIKNKELIEKMKAMVSLDNDLEISLLELFRSLDDAGKRDAIFKIETAKKVMERFALSKAS